MTSERKTVSVEVTCLDEKGLFTNFIYELPVECSRIMVSPLMGDLPSGRIVWGFIEGQDGNVEQVEGKLIERNNNPWMA